MVCRIMISSLAMTMKHGSQGEPQGLRGLLCPAAFKPWPGSARRRLDPPMNRKSLAACFQEAGICIAGGGAVSLFRGTGRNNTSADLVGL
jgi:hypothetical protein